MFCPKCGTNNPDDGKFCRSCGADIANVPAAMTGSLASDLGLTCGDDGKPKRLKTADEIFGDSIKSIISGVGFLIVSCVLFVTNVAGGRAWFWAFLFPAFTFLAKGISDYAKSRRMERNRQQFVSYPQTATLNSTQVSSLPPPQANFVSPESRYQTGDLVPPSVTDGTTKLLELELDQEGQTRTLPKV